MKINLYLKNGQVLKVNHHSITIQTSKITNETVGFKWTNRRSWWRRKKWELLDVNLNEVIAVLVKK